MIDIEFTVVVNDDVAFMFWSARDTAICGFDV